MEVTWHACMLREIRLVVAPIYTSYPLIKENPTKFICDFSISTCIIATSSTNHNHTIMITNRPFMLSQSLGHAIHAKLPREIYILWEITKVFHPCKTGTEFKPHYWSRKRASIKRFSFSPSPKSDPSSPVVKMNTSTNYNIFSCRWRVTRPSPVHADPLHVRMTGFTTRVCCALFLCSLALLIFGSLPHDAGNKLDMADDMMGNLDCSWKVQRGCLMKCMRHTSLIGV